jgi:hypothetical protein
MCILGWLPGCVAPLGKRPGLLLDKPTQPEPSAPTKPAEATPQATLTAIEEFLQRTAEYQLPDANPQVVPPARPAAPRTGPASGKTAVEAAQKPATVEAATRPSAQVFANTQVQIQEITPPTPPPAIPVFRSVSIRSTPEPDAGPVEPVRTNATNEALDLRSAADATVHADGLISSLKKRAAEASDFDSEWRLRLTQLALDRDAEAHQVAAHLPQETRGMLAALIGAAQAIRSLARNAAATGQDALQKVDELRQVVADRADPAIARVALCRKVVTFGVYDEMSAEDFVAGRTTQTIVYSEIRNFRSESTDDGHYRTQLATRLEALTAGGQSVWQRAEPEIVDKCRGRRTDFFIAQRITLPSTLPAGEYVLKVLVEDALSGKADEATHLFTITSPTAIAAGG